MKTLLQTAIEAPALAQSILKEMAEGKRATGLEWGEDILSGRVPLKEMIGTDDGASEFVEKTTFDLYQGRENVPLLYKGIYSTLTDANFPEVLRVEEFGPVQVVFLEKYEGGEVKFGAMGPGTEKFVKFVTYAAGIEYDEDIIEYNKTWRVTEINIAFGEAYNKLLNHIHLNPIISATYTTTGGGAAAQKVAQEDGTAQLVAFDTDVETTLKKALQILPRGRFVLHNSFDINTLENAIAGSMLPDLQPDSLKRTLSNSTFVAYDGDEVVVRNRTYTYTGVAAGFVYMLVPKQNFKEYVKHDLRVDSDNGDLSRLIIAQVVGRARRAVFAGVGGKYGAVKVDIAA
jgi:hypothetical protein